MSKFEDRLEARLTEADRDRISPRTAAEVVPTSRAHRRLVRPLALGFVASLVVTGAVVGSGLLGQVGFQAAGDVQVAGDNLAAKGSGCASGAAVTVSLDGRQLGTVNASQAGDFSTAPIRIPPDTAVGAHAVQASCADNAGKPVVQTVTIQVVSTRPSHGPVLEVNALQALPGGGAVIKGGSVKIGTDVAISLDGVPLKTIHISEGGDFTATITLPADTSLGTHHVRAVGIASDGGPFDQTVELEVGTQLATPPPAR